MKLYSNLQQQEYIHYLRPDILDTIEKHRHRWKKLTYHEKYLLPSILVLTNDGVEYFKDFSKQIDIFRMPPNFTSNIHIDNSFYAYNFIIKGSGIMEWFNIDDLTVKHISEYGTQIYDLLDNKSSIGSTTSTSMIVNTKIPHRIINNHNEERICVSIRNLVNLF